MILLKRLFLVERLLENACGIEMLVKIENRKMHNKWVRQIQIILLLHNLIEF